MSVGFFFARAVHSTFPALVKLDFGAAVDRADSSEGGPIRRRWVALLEPNRPRVVGEKLS